MTRWSCATLVFAMVLCAVPADAADSLYTGLAYVTGQMEETRLPGFGRALEEVLVKVSGDARLGADPRVAALTGEAARYVETFSYRDRMADIPIHDEQGTRERPFELTVAFVHREDRRAVGDARQGAMDGSPRCRGADYCHYRRRAPLPADQRRADTAAISATRWPRKRGERA